MSTTRQDMDGKLDATAEAALETELLRYASWLAKAEPVSSRVERFRRRHPRRFLALCKFHLSLLVDVPADFLDGRWVRESAVASPMLAGARQAPESTSATTTDSESESTAEKRPPSTTTATTTSRWPAAVSWAKRRTTAANSTTSTASIEAPITRAACRRIAPTPAAALSSGLSIAGDSHRRVIPDNVVENLIQLMHHIDKEEYLKAEGIFRKTGNVVRQRDLRRRIMHSTSLRLEGINGASSEPKPWRPPGRCNLRYSSADAAPTLQQQHQQTQQSQQSQQQQHISVHDLAAGLKGVLYDLSEPLLTEELLPMFVQVANFTTGRLDDRGHRVLLRPVEERLAHARQLKALRILHLLLPDPQRRLWKRLLVLLQRTLAFTPENRMTAESLGTLFGPLLLAPGKVYTRDLHLQYPCLSRLATLMIRQGCIGLFAMPSSLGQDIDKNIRLLKSSAPALHGASHHSDCVSAGSTLSLTRTLSSDSGLSGCDMANTGHSGTSSVTAMDCDSGRAGSVCLSRIRTSHSESDEAAISDSEVMPALVTNVVFAKRSSFGRGDGTPGTPTRLHPSPALPSATSPSVLGEFVGGAMDTEYAVAELCAAVQALPDTDPRKRRLIQRFNASNGGLTPSLSTYTTGPATTSTTASSVGQRGVFRVGLDRSPSPKPALVRQYAGGRPNLSDTQTAAARAAKTIRSSLRRRLAIRSNISMSNCFRSPTSKRPTPVAFDTPMPHQPRLDEEDGSPLPLQLHTLPTQQRALIVVDARHTASPTIDAAAEPTSGTDLSEARNSTAGSSSTSIDSSATQPGELTLCCPLVEALASPFRRFTDKTGAPLASGTSSTGSAAAGGKRRRAAVSSRPPKPPKTTDRRPITTALRHARLRTPGESPTTPVDERVKQGDLGDSTPVALQSQSSLDSVLNRSQILDGTYYPICVPSPFSSPSTMNAYARIVRCSSVGNILQSNSPMPSLIRSNSQQDGRLKMSPSQLKLTPTTTVKL